MKANSTGGINYSTIKKYLIIAITFLSMLIISLITIVICNSNSILNSSSNNKNSVFAEETFAEAQNKYVSTIMYNIIYSNRLPLTSTSNSTYYDSKTRTVYWVTHAAYDSSQSAEEYEDKTGITSKNLTYNISTATEYANFCKLTHHRTYVQTGSYTYANVAIGKYVSVPTYKNYETYPFYHDEVGLTLYTIGNNSIVFSSGSRQLDFGEQPPYNAFSGKPPIKETTFSLNKFRMNVSLNTDVELTLHNGKVNDEKENMLYFKGSFNGNGHTISFQGTDKYYPAELEFYDGDTKCYSPFCCFLDSEGEIKNIKLDYSNLKYLLIDDGWTAASYAGGIVGYNKGTVQICIVNSPRVYSQRYNSNAHFGALVGVNDGACHNCAVTGEYYIRAHGWNVGNPDGINAYWGSASGNSVSRSVFSASVVEDKDQAKTQDFIRSPADVGKTAGKNQLAYNSQNEASSYDVNNGGIRKTDSSYSGLASISSEGGSSEETGELWYFASDYDDIPHLRVFLTWKKIFFKSANEAIVKPTVDYIKVPKDAYKFGSKAGADIEIYGQTIKATIASGYSIAGWNWSESDLTYTVQYGNETINLKFFGLQENVTVLARGVEFPGEYIVLKNSIIEIDTKYYDNDTIESITYKFTAIVDNKTKIAIFIFRGAKTDVLLSSQTYYLKHNINNKSTESFYATDDYVTTVLEKSAIRIYCPTAVKKSYGITVT